MGESLGTAAVMGAGAWGTALAKVLADAGSDVVVWARRPEVAEEITARHTNHTYLPGVALPHAVRATADPAEALDQRHPGDVRERDRRPTRRAGEHP